MNANEYFKRVAQAEEKLKILRAKLHHYEDLGLMVGSHAGGEGSKSQHNNTSRVEAAAIGMVDTFAALMEEIRQYDAIVKAAERVIDQISQEKFRRILKLYYLCGWSMSAISDDLRYDDPKSVYRARGFALREAGRILDNEKAVSL